MQKIRKTYLFPCTRANVKRQGIDELTYLPQVVMAAITHANYGYARICSGEALLAHFITYGMDEGRRANEEFDVLDYAKYNPDVAEEERYQMRGCYLHYIVYGIEEGRRTR